MKPQFSGTITAIITPFREGQIDWPALDALIERQVAAGVDGIVACGTTGESPTLSKAEHAQVIERVIRTARKRTLVLAGTGSNSTDETIRMSQHAAQAGADGLLLVAPYYNRPSQAGLFEHFSAIARQVDRPIMLYNIPGRCGVEISIDTICRLYAAHADRIVSVKHATGRVDDAAELMSRCDISVVSGDDPITWPLMALGAVGVVSVISNLAPRHTRKLSGAALAGDQAAARAAHVRLYALAKPLLSLDVNPIPIKAACAIKGWCADELRLPLVRLSSEKREALAGLLRQNDLD